MPTNPYGAYLESTIVSASSLDLVSMAYQAAIEAIQTARAHLAGKRIVERSRAITRAQSILVELQSSLDFNKGGDLSVQLARLYDYIQGRLREGNFRQIEEPLAEAQTLLETIGEAWKEIASKENASASVAAAATSPS